MRIYSLWWTCCGKTGLVVFWRGTLWTMFLWLLVLACGTPGDEVKSGGAAQLDVEQVSSAQEGSASVSAAEANQAPSQPLVTNVPATPSNEQAADLPPASVAPDGSLPADAPERIAAQHVLIAHQGAAGADTRLSRSREEGRALAEELRAAIVAGRDFDTVAKENSDCRSASRGGHLYAFGHGAMHADFETAAFALAEDEISAVVETPFGHHLIKRIALEEIRVAHVLVQWAGLPRTRATRSKETARSIAEAAHTRLMGGEVMAQVAEELSDGPMATRGGDLGWFQRGQMNPAFDGVAFALSSGQTSAIVETPIGYHVIQRLD